MTIDHDAIAARVRQDRKAGTPGPWKCGNNNPTRVTREGRYIANFDPLHSNAPKCEIDARRAAHMPDLEAAYLDLYDEVAKLRANLHHVLAERDATFALMLARAEAVRIKPLEWACVHTYAQDVFDAIGVGMVYRIIPQDGHFWLTVPGVDNKYPTIDAAKDAANADNEARVLSQIDAVPAAQVRAEALREVLADDEMCLRLAEGYDREDAAQRGEPSPHTMGDEGYAEWAADRIACAKAGLRALIKREPT